MTSSRPYKCIKDIIDDDTGKMFTVDFTLNLFDVTNWCECSNELDNIKDNIKRTVVFIEGGTSHIIRVPYKEFDTIVLQLKKDYQMLDDRSMVPPDRVKYKGFIQSQGTSRKDMLAVTFHRQGFIPKDYEDFVYHHLFSNINPMN